MTAPKNEPGTAVATRKAALPADIQARVDENRARNMMVTAIRGTQWGKDCSQEMARAVAQYCRENNLDPVRHVEILGGRIYLTAELYDEKGAHLLRSGEIIPDKPDYINADERLDKLASDGDAWAIEERTRRLRLRIEHAVPEKAAAAVVQIFRLKSGAAIVGVNWCGGGSRTRDPVGDAEPTKTAQTRARRRAWKQVADIVPGYAEIIKPLEGTAKIASEMLPVAVVEAPAPRPDLRIAAPADGAYGLSPSEPEPSSESDEDLLAQDRATVEAEADGELPLGNTRRARRMD